MPEGGRAPLNQNAPPRKNPLKDVVVIIVLPWLVFALLLLMFLFCYHDLAVLVWALVVVCFALSLVFLGLGFGVKHRTFIAIGLLCFASSVTGTIVGKWLNDNYLERYYTLEQSDVAANLDPTVNPGAKELAIFKFQNMSFVDDMRTVGFMADRQIFCVAPVSKPMAYNASVEFWATGEDCCEPRRNFDCGTAREQATIAIVATPNKYYDKAISQAKALYSIPEGPSKPRLVYFVKGTEHVKGFLWEQSLTICLFASILDLLMCAAAGAVMTKVLRQKNAQQSQIPS
jgi:hypothetical protein